MTLLHRPGFSTIKREGIQLAGAFVATVNADMRVGALEETITVTGETPVVDVQSTTRRTTGQHLEDAFRTSASSFRTFSLAAGRTAAAPEGKLHSRIWKSTAAGRPSTPHLRPRAAEQPRIFRPKPQIEHPMPSRYTKRALVTDPLDKRHW